MIKEKKHVLFIQTDQWSGSYFGFAGHPSVMTPTIDQLARDGIVFDRCYSTCPVCIPARRSLMTGTSPRTHGDRLYQDRLPMPEMPTLAEAFKRGGYQTVAVGKLHVYPQRNRIGFDEVILQEEGRYEFGVVDDYQIWLGEQGYVGQEFAHGMGNNTYLARPWPLPEYTHPTAWTTREMVRQIKRRDPCRPFFFYISYQFPHPPLVPPADYLAMYGADSVIPPVEGDWEDDSLVIRYMTENSHIYSAREIQLARRAYFAQCTYIDHQIRLLIGTLREQGLLHNTLIVFTSDHGDMLFDHHIVGKRCFYEASANIPLIFSGKPVEEKRGMVDGRLACLEDVMPTLLEFCGLPKPETVEGFSLFGDETRHCLFGEISEGVKATRMILDERYKLIYYPFGNKKQLFDIKKDRQELHDLAGHEKYRVVSERLEEELIRELYGEDRRWVVDGKLVGEACPEYAPSQDYVFSNQRGLHWPPPEK